MWLLTKFVVEKRESYVAPLKRETKKGSQNPFSKAKYNASLIMLMDPMVGDNYKKLAKRLGVSYGVLRKWVTEDAFNKMVDKHCEEFSEIFLKNLLNENKKTKKELQKYLKKPLSKIADTPAPLTNMASIITDWTSCNTDLKSKILESCIKKIKAKDELIKEEDKFILYTDILTLLGTVGSKRRKKKINDLAKIAKTGFLEETRKILSKQKFTEKEKKYIIMYLATFSDIISQEGFY